MPYSVEWSNFQAGPQAIEAENAGSIDLAYMADTPPIFAQAAGVQVSVVAMTMAPRGARNIALLVQPQSRITRAADLRGKRVAMVPGTVTQYLLIRALTEAQVPLDEVESAALQAPDAVTALRRGDVDAAVLVDPSAATAVHARVGRVLLTGKGLVSGSNTFVASRDALAQARKEALMGDFLHRVQVALTWARQHPIRWAKVYGRAYHLPEAVARDTVLKSAAELVPIDPDRIAAQQQQANAFQQAGMLSSHLDVAAEFDDRYNKVLFPR
jgi:sulfonate transport system substrate-binding protein